MNEPTETTGKGGAVLGGTVAARGTNTTPLVSSGGGDRLNASDSLSGASASEEERRRAIDAWYDAAEKRDELPDEFQEVKRNRRFCLAERGPLLFCTRPVWPGQDGHRGQHVATASFAVIAVWPREDVTQ